MKKHTRFFFFFLNVLFSVFRLPFARSFDAPTYAARDPLGVPSAARARHSSSARAALGRGAAYRRNRAGRASMGRDVHRRLLRHVPDDDFASRASAAGAYDAPGAYTARYHSASPLPSSRFDGARETSSFHDNPRVSSSSSSASSASEAASTVTVFLFILLPVVFLVHCCCCGTRADTFDPGFVTDGHRGRRRRRVEARERRGRRSGESPRRETASRDAVHREGEAMLSARGSRTTGDDAAMRAAASPTALEGVDDATCDEPPGPASNATITSLPRCIAGDGDWASLFGDERETSACLVCCDEIERGQDVRVMACAHAFHAGCIRAWLKVSGSCPACRHPATRLAAGERETFWRARRGAGAPPPPPPPPPPNKAAEDDEDGEGERDSAGDAETQR